jgi:hypothetical protein
LFKDTEADSSKNLVFMSDLWLDDELVLEKLFSMFKVYEDMKCPPIAFVMMGNFLSAIKPNESLDRLEGFFCKL